MQIKRKPRVLFTGGGGAGSEALNRLLSPNYEVYFADADLNSVSQNINSEKCHEIPMANDPHFVNSIVSLSKKLKLDLLVPTVDEELLPLRDAEDAMDCRILLPSKDFISLHLDKLKSAQCLINAGLPAPRTSIVGEMQEEFPLILKPRTGRGSRNVSIVSSKQELDAQLLLSRMEASKFIVQELVHGQEYTVMMVANAEKKLRAVVPVLVGHKKGITIEAETVNDKEIICACTKIHELNPVSGYYNIQLIKEDGGSVKPFEINPRVSTTACLGLAAGVDFVAIALEERNVSVAFKNQLLPFKEKLKLKRFWYNQIYV